ncbi:MAG: Holliday junction branch migration protein RuvA [bacterium]|nr:Holliday junction branch migration protein RuvA [bacterium]
MISFVRGTVASTGVDRLVIDLGAVGVSVTCTPATARTVRHGEHIELMTSMVVREDGWTLYGFLDADERATFEQTQTVSGIGPRIALALLESLSPDDLRRAVVTADEAALMKVSGIGRKGAQRLILELGDRLGPPSPALSPSSGSLAAGWRASVEAGLTSLGWSAREAERAVAAIDPQAAATATAAGANADISALLKAALRTLDRS